MKRSAIILFFLIGCNAPADISPESVTYDGEEAYQFVADVVSFGARIPGSDAHGAAWNYLHTQLQVPGWIVSSQNFTGQQYEELTLADVDVYRTHAGYCSDEDRSRMLNLTFSNLVSVQAGSGPLVLFGAHWDSKRFASNEPGNEGPVIGANDGASGVGALLQLQRHVSHLQLDYRVGIAFFDGEDGFEDCHPLAGSMYYQEAGETPAAFILLDMVGDVNARFVRETQSDVALMDIIWQYGPAPQFTDTRKQVIDDHVPFVRNGVPSVDIIDFGRSTGFPPYWHTTHDTMDNISSEALAIVGQTLLNAMQDPDFPG